MTFESSLLLRLKLLCDNFNVMIKIPDFRGQIIIKIIPKAWKGKLTHDL